MAITGKTGEKIIVSGDYYCQTHTHTDRHLLKEDTFPKCETNEHEAIWVYREKNDKDNNSNDFGNTGADTEKTGKDKTEKATDAQPAIDNDGIELKLRYSRKGFYEAIHYKKTGDAGHLLQSVLDAQRSLTATETAALEDVYAVKMKTLNDRLAELGELLIEKTGIQNAYVIELSVLATEYKKLKTEIETLNNDLRDALTDLGQAKEQIIQKRIDEFGKEINKIADVYQELEDKHNNKFKLDFNRTAPSEKDKKFYMDYRDHLQETFDDVAARISMLERDGLNVFLAKALIYLGWIAVLTSSWFFTQLISDLPGFNIKGNNTLIVFILDGLTTFIQKHKWWSLIPLAVYLAIVGAVIYYCHLALKKIDKKKDKKTKEKEKQERDALEMDTDYEGLIKASMKADNLYEFWLKIAPIITMVILLVVILAIGNNEPGAGITGSTLYEDLSNAMALQGVSTLIPLTFAALFFLYISFMENRAVQSMENIRPDGGKIKVFRKGRSWEVVLSMVGILVLMALLLTYIFPVFPHFQKPVIVYAWGFFISCICTGMSLAYGYRFMALNRSYFNLINRLDNINIYIGHIFNPYQVHYAKNFVLQLRKTGLYHSFIKMLEQRNSTTMRMLGYKEPFVNEEQKEDEETLAERREKVARKLRADVKRSIELMKKLGIFTNVLNYVYRKIFRIKDEKKKLEKELEALKGNKVQEDELTYFPEKAMRIKELKINIDSKTNEMNAMKAEIDGYYKETATYGNIQQKINDIQKDIDNARARREELLQEMEMMKDDMASLLEDKLVYLQEGYTIGMWFNDEDETDENITMDAK